MSIKFHDGYKEGQLVVLKNGASGRAKLMPESTLGCEGCVFRGKDSNSCINDEYEYRCTVYNFITAKYDRYIFE